MRQIELLSSWSFHFNATKLKLLMITILSQYLKSRVKEGKTERERKRKRERETQRERERERKKKKQRIIHTLKHHLLKLSEAKKY